MPIVYEPDRMFITNLETGDDMNAQFNPEKLNEKIKVNWSKLSVLGLSHMPKQYQQTDNWTCTFELKFWAWDSKGNRLNDIKQKRRQLMSYCYSSRAAPRTVSGGAPPRLNFFWPNLIDLTCTLESLEFNHVRFNRKGDPIESVAIVTLEEIRDVRLYSEDVRATGTIRSGTLSPGQAVGSNVIVSDD